MNIIPWRRRDTIQPFSTDFEDFLDRLWGNGQGLVTNRLPEVFRGRAFPAVNVAETEDAFSITMDCPGLAEKDIEVEAMGSNLVISGERRWEEEKKGKEYRRVESQYGKFERTIALPENIRIEPGEVKATYDKGVLTVTVPKLERTPAAKIPVKAR